MSIKDFDWKNFLLMRGERLGLVLCIVTALVLIVLSLFMPHHGFFTGSGAVNAQDLNALIGRLQTALNTNKPTDDENPKEAGKVDLHAKVDIDRAKYQLTSLFLPGQQGETRRRVPELLLPDEGSVEVALAQLKGYIFNKDQTRMMVLKDQKAAKNAVTTQVGNALASRGGGIGGGGGMRGGGAMRGGGGGAMRGGGGGAMRGGGGMPSLGNGVPSASSSKPELDFEFVPIEKVSTTQGRLAETVLPQPMAIIYASFPYKKEIEQYMKQLQLSDPRDVLSETSFDADHPERPVPAFRFLGVRAERRQVDSEGKVLKDSDWAPLKLEESYKDFIIMCGGRKEPEDPRLATISFNGLVMRRLPQFRENQYPDGEMRLENIKSTLESLTAKDPEQVVLPTFLNPDSFDIFGGGEAPPASTGGGRTGPAGAMSGGGRRMGAEPGAGGGFRPGGEGGGGFRPGGEGGGGRGGLGRGNRSLSGAEGGRSQPGANAVAGSELILPEHCLVRLIDVTIEPGKIYQYRIKVRMANPNYGRQDVASPLYATEPELTNNNWFEIPDKVFVPPDLLIYAVDQKEIDGPRAYKGRPYDKLVPEKDRQVILQIHKWLQSVDEQGNNYRPIGEWVVAQRLAVYRGEYISRKLLCEVPEWKVTREEFILAAESTLKARKKESGITIDFSEKVSDNNPVLVDFEGPDLVVTREVRGRDDKVETKYIKDKMPIEVLILSPEGKLLARDYATDTHDKAREKRLKAYLDRIEEVKEARTPTPAAGTKPGQRSSPFGRGGEN